MRRNGKLRLPMFLAALTLILGYFAVGNVEAQAWIWVQYSNPSPLNDAANGIAAQYFTGVYVVGYDMVGGNERWRIEKRNPLTGALLWTQTSNPSSGNDRAQAVAVDGGGVYVVGFDNAAGNARWRIEKRRSDGLLVWTQTNNPSSGNDVAYGVAVYATSLYVVGYDMTLGNARWRVERRNATNGALLAWAWSNPSTGIDMAQSVAVGPAGVFIAGYDNVGGNPRWRIERRNPSTLALIWTQTSNPSNGDDRAEGIALSSTNIYVVGSDWVGGNARWRIERRSPVTGALLATAVSNPSNGSDSARSVAVGVTGLYVAGFDSAGGNARWRVEKRNLSSLAVVWSDAFNPSAGDDRIQSVCIDQTGVYIAGYDRTTSSRWRIEKRMPSDV